MRILIATPMYPPAIGGPATFSKAMVEEASRLGAEVGVIDFGEVKHLPRGIRHIVYCYRLLRAAPKADVVLALDPTSVGVPAAFAAAIMRKPFFVRIAGDIAWEQGMQRFGVKESLDTFSKHHDDRYGFWVQLYKKVQTAVARRATRIIVPSKYLKRIVSNWGIPKRDITVIHSSIKMPDELGNRRTLRGLLQFNGKLVMSVGRLVPWKGFTTLVHVIDKLRHSVPNIKLFIVGSGPQEAELEALITKLGLEEHVALAGALEHDVLMRYLSAADAFVLNTFYEGFSHQLLETLAVGTPVIATDVGGNPELIENNKNGLLVKYDNKKALAKALEDVLSDRNLARRLTAAGRKTAAEHDQKIMVRDVITTLKKGSR